MKEKIQKFFACLLGTVILFSIAFFVFAVVARLGGSLMRIFGFDYKSVGQLLIYFISAALLSLPLELFSTALPRALYRMGKVSRRQGNLLYIPLDTLCTIISFWLADQWIEGVSASALSLCILGLSMALVTLPIKEKSE